MPVTTDFTKLDSHCVFRLTLLAIRRESWRSSLFSFEISPAFVSKKKAIQTISNYSYDTYLADCSYAVKEVFDFLVLI